MNLKQKMKFKFLKHTADIKFQAFGSSLEEAFKNSALALTYIMYKGKIKPVIKKRIVVKGKDKANLLYTFLEEFLFLLDSENFLLSRIEKLKINKNREYELEAEVLGDSVENYKPELDVKAVTYNEMFVRSEKNKFVCQVVVDV